MAMRILGSKAVKKEAATGFNPDPLPLVARR